MLLHALPDITGDNAVHPMSAVSLKGKWVQIIVPSTNTAPVRIGGPEVSSTVGLPIPIGYAGQMFPPISEPFEFYDLSLVHYYAATGDKLYVLYGG